MQHGRGITLRRASSFDYAQDFGSRLRHLVAPQLSTPPHPALRHEDSAQDDTGREYGHGKR